MNDLNSVVLEGQVLSTPSSREFVIATKRIERLGRDKKEVLTLHKVRMIKPHDLKRKDRIRVQGRLHDKGTIIAESCKRLPLTNARSEA